MIRHSDVRGDIYYDLWLSHTDATRSRNRYEMDALHNNAVRNTLHSLSVRYHGIFQAHMDGYDLGLQFFMSRAPTIVYEMTATFVLMKHDTTVASLFLLASAEFFGYSEDSRFDKHQCIHISDNSTQSLAIASVCVLFGLNNILAMFRIGEDWCATKVRACWLAQLIWYRGTYLGR